MFTCRTCGNRGNESKIMNCQKCMSDYTKWGCYPNWIEDPEAIENMKGEQNETTEN